MRIIKALFLIFLFLLISINIFSDHPVSSDGISIWPGKLTITMSDDYPKEEIKYEIEVNNLNSFDINVTAEIANPSLQRLNNNYTFIPDLSWVQIVSDITHISPHENRFLEVIINIPDEEKPLHFNEKWEFWVVISETNVQSPDNGAFIQTELISKFFVITPTIEGRLQMPQFVYIVLLFFIVLIALYIFFVIKHKRTGRGNKQRIFYFKKKKKN